MNLFYDDFIVDNRYKYILKGLGNTLLITLFAVLIGIAIGFLIAIIRSSHDKMDRPGFFVKFLNVLSKLYLAVIRGTPTVVQLLISFFIIFTSPNASKLMVATLTFGINSGAYVAEIIRSGIMSIDGGQMEAGRSLGLNYAKTMRHIIMPQAFKNVLPALANEFIVLLKETSICGYIGMMDLTKGGDIIRSATYDPFLPLLTVAAIYLVLVCGLSALVGRLERRLRTSER